MYTPPTQVYTPPTQVYTPPTQVYTPPTQVSITKSEISGGLKLKKFDISKIKEDNVIVIVGARNTGKSYIVKDILWHNQSLPCGTVISGTEGANHFYGKLVPQMSIHKEYHPEIIANVLMHQKLVAKNSSKDPRNILVLDDCLYDQSWISDRNIRHLFMNSRHFHTMFIVTMLYAMNIPPVLRFDYVFILRENIISNQRKLYAQYAGMFPDFDLFCQVMKQCTENFECLVIDNKAMSNKLEDQVFWYKATSHND
jgi:hypothetical protein